MRTLDGAIELLKQEDSGCQLTRWALRSLVLSEKVPGLSVTVGSSKRLVNVDVLLAYLAGDITEILASDQTGKIRKIS